MSNNRHKTICAPYLILLKNDRVLLLRRQGSGYHDGDYSLPAGHLEADESLMNALSRETKEEIGIDLDLQKTRLAHVMHRSNIDPPYFDFFFTSSNWDGTPTILETEKCDNLQWFSLDALPSNTIPYIRSAIIAATQDISYSET